jgi:hypothetical protein
MHFVSVVASIFSGQGALICQGLFSESLSFANPFFEKGDIKNLLLSSDVYNLSFKSKTTTSFRAATKRVEETAWSIVVRSTE